MAVWLVRAGRTGARDELALREKCAVIGFHELGDLSDAKDRDDIRQRLLAVAPSLSAGAAANWAGQVWTFLSRINVGDIVVLPLKSRGTIALGKVTGPYSFHADAPGDARHRRAVDWIREDVSRSAFGQDLLYSFGAFMTVCQITRNGAEERVAAVLAGKPDPGISADGLYAPVDDSSATSESSAIAFDIEAHARDRIVRLVETRFSGHDLARLVGEILAAQGYHTDTSTPGADEGVDVLVGGGPMGFDSPRIVVQVKMGEGDSPMLRDLQGTVQNFGADRGLLVAWRGFKRGVRANARRSFFTLRLWDAGDLIDELTSVYDRLPASTRDALPLTQIWTVVGGESDAE